MKYIIVSSLVAFAACGQQPDPGTRAETAQRVADASLAGAEKIQLNAEQFKRAGIKTAILGTRKVNRVIKVNGIAEAPPENRYTISFPLGGYIKTNNLIPGMYAKKGTLLATIEDAAFIQLQHDYLLSGSRLQFLREDFLRQQELSKTNSNSLKAFQQAKTDFESEKITNRALEEKLRLIGIDPEQLTENNLSRTVNIISPINGYISKVNANPGKYAAPTDVLFELVNPRHLHLSLTVFANDAALIKKGQKVYFSSNISPEKKSEAIVELITPDLDQNMAVEVHCELRSPVAGLLPGAFINAEINVATQSAAAVPDEAVVRWQNNHFIFTEEGELVFSMFPVETGITADGLTEITSRLPEDKKIVIANAYTLLGMLKNKAEEE